MTPGAANSLRIHVALKVLLGRPVFMTGFFYFLFISGLPVLWVIYGVNTVTLLQVSATVIFPGLLGVR
jgi:hypothetical protein